MSRPEIANYINLSPNLIVSGRDELCPSNQPDNTPSSPPSAAEEEELQTVLSRLIREASSTYALGDVEKALSIYDELVRIDATNNVLFANRSAILLKLERVEEAIKDAKYSIKLKADWPKAHFRLADALKEYGDFENAILSYTNSLKMSPESEQFLAALINCVSNSQIQEDFVKMHEDIKAVGLQTNPFIIISGIAQTYLNNYDESEGNVHFIINLLEMSILILDTYSFSRDLPITVRQSVYGALAKAYFLAENNEKSIQFCLTCLEWAKESCDVQVQMNLHANIVENAIRLQNFDIAIFHQKEKICLIESKQMKGLTNAKQRLGDLLIWTGDFQLAKKIFQEIIAADSANIRAHFGIGQALFYMRDYLSAKLIFEQVEELSNPSQMMNELRDGLIFEATLFKCKCIFSSRCKSAKMRHESVNEIIETLNRLIESDFSVKLENSKPEMLGKVYSLLSTCHQTVENWQYSWKFAYVQLKMALISQDLPLHADSLIQLSNIFTRNGDLHSAIILAEKLQCLVVENFVLNNKIWKKVSLALLANVHLAAKKYFKAANYFEEFLKIYSDDMNVEDQVEAHIKIIRIYAILDIQETRERHLNSIKDLIARARQEHSTHNVDESQMLEWEMCWNEELGDYLLCVQNSNSNLSNVITHYEKALMIAQELEQNASEAQLCEKLGRAHLSVGNSANHAETSSVYFRQFLAIAQQFRDVEAILRAYTYLSDAYLRMYCIDDALEDLKYQVTLADLLGHYAQKCRAMLAIGRILLVEQADVEMALKVFKKAQQQIRDADKSTDELLRLLKTEFTLVESLSELDDLIRALDENEDLATTQTQMLKVPVCKFSNDNETPLNEKSRHQKNCSDHRDRQKDGSKRKSVRSCKSEAGKWRRSFHEEATFSDVEVSENGATTEAETVESLSGAVVLGVEFCDGSNYDDDDGDYEEIEDGKLCDDICTFV